MGDFLQTSLTKERRRIMSLKTCVKVVAPLLLVTLCTAAPYEASPSSTAAPPAPEKLVQTGKGVQCSVQYITIWDTEYEDKPFEECETVYKQLCEVESQRLCQETTKEECRVVKDKVCTQEYKKVCVDEYKTVLEPYTETECVTTYKEDCEYHWEIVGTEKVWAPIKDSCKKNPYDECHDVPQEKCHYLDRKECYQVPHQTCKSQPITKCQEVPKEICHLKHKRVPVRVSKTIPKEVCDTGYGDHSLVPEQEFLPVPAVPVLITTQPPLTDVINRNDQPSFAFSSGNSLDDNEPTVPEFDKLVFQDNSNSTINFEE